MAMPSIACLGVIGKNNNPLHVSIFPSYLPTPTSTQPSPIRTPLQFSLLLSSSLDIFEARSRSSSGNNNNNGGGGNGNDNASNTGGSGNGPLSGDYGLLQALDERLALYGFETNTGVKFVVVVDMRGRRLKGVGVGVEDGGGGLGDGGDGVPGMKGSTGGGKGRAAAAGVVGLREGEMKVVFRAMQASYVRLLQNPFYDPDEHSPAMGRGGKRITSGNFAADMQRIGESWMPGKTVL